MAISVKAQALQAPLSASVGVAPLLADAGEGIVAPQFLPQTTLPDVAKYFADVDTTGLLSAEPRVAGLIDSLIQRSSHVRWIDGKDIHDVTTIGANNDNYRRWVADVSSGIAEGLSTVGGPKPSYILYPFSGYGLSDAVAVFPEADTYVLMDQNPFVIARNEAELPTQIVCRVKHVHDVDLGFVDEAHRLCANVAKERGILPLMIAKMRAAFPDVQFIRAGIFQTPEITKVRSGQALYDAFETHGLLQFRLKHGGPVKTAIFINRYLSANDLPLLPFDISFSDGLLIKGSMGTLIEEILQQTFLSIILKNRGLVVFGGDDLISPRTMSAWSEYLTAATSLNLKLSYNEQTYIFRFKRINSDVDLLGACEPAGHGIIYPRSDKKIFRRAELERYLDKISLLNLQYFSRFTSELIDTLFKLSAGRKLIVNLLLDRLRKLFRASDTLELNIEDVRESFFRLFFEEYPNYFYEQIWKGVSPAERHELKKMKESHPTLKRLLDSPIGFNVTPAVLQLLRLVVEENVQSYDHRLDSAAYSVLNDSYILRRSGAGFLEISPIHFSRVMWLLYNDRFLHSF